jgi:hypothetical protein
LKELNEYGCCYLKKYDEHQNRGTERSQVKQSSLHTTDGLPHLLALKPHKKATLFKD